MRMELHEVGKCGEFNYFGFDSDCKFTINAQALQYFVSFDLYMLNEEENMLKVSHNLFGYSGLFL